MAVDIQLALKGELINVHEFKHLLKAYLIYNTRDTHLQSKVTAVPQPFFVMQVPP